MYFYFQIKILEAGFNFMIFDYNLEIITKLYYNRILVLV